MSKSKVLRLVLFNVFAYLLLATSIVLDLCFEFHSETLSDFSAIMYPTVITTAGFLVTIYVVFIEIYKERYSFKGMEKNHFPNTRVLFQIILFDIISGGITLCVGKGYISFAMFCATALASVVVIVYYISKANESLRLNSYIEKFCKQIESEVNDKHKQISIGTINNIKNVLDECVMKEEYHSVSILVERIGEIFRVYLSNRINISCQADKSHELFKDSFEDIVDLNIFELKLCENIKSLELNKKIVRQQRKNLCFCIEHSQLEYFKRYLDSYLHFLFRLQNKTDSETINLIYYSLPPIVKLCYDKDKTEYATHFLDEISKMNYSHIRINKSGSAKHYIMFLTVAVDFAIETKNKSLLEYSIDKICDILYLLAKHSEMFTEFTEYYKMIFYRLFEYNYSDALSFYEKNKDLLSYGYTQNPSILEFKVFCLNALMDDTKIDESNKNKLFGYHIELICEITKAKEKYTGYIFFPDFEKMINYKHYVREEMSEITAQYRKILDRCILSDNISMYYSFVQHLDELLAKTQSRHKDIQEDLLNIYFWMISRTSQLANKQFTEITFYSLHDIIVKMDNNRAITEPLAKYILNSLCECCRENVFKSADISVRIIDLLFDLSYDENPCRFIMYKTDTKKLLCKTLFNIGTDCIENGFEEGVRKVSNALGWLTIHSIEQLDDIIVKYLIHRVSELYNIATNMNVSHQTRMFMLTLFPTVGAFCCDDIYKKKYVNMIIAGIRQENPENVRTAVRLRTSENDMWNNLYKGRTDELTRKFMEQYNNSIAETKELVTV